MILGRLGEGQNQFLTRLAEFLESFENHHADTIALEHAPLLNS